MSYTRAERQQIAAQIWAYMEAGKVHKWEQRTTVLASGTVELPAMEYQHEASTYQLAILDLTARDVLGEIKHDTMPTELRGINTARHA